MSDAPRKLSHYFTHSKRKGRAGLPLVSVTMHDGLVRRDTLDRKTDSALLDEEHLLVEPGDIAYNMMRMWQGALGLADEAANVSPAYGVMRPKNTVDPRFAKHWFKSDRGLYMLWAYSYGLTEDRLRLYPNEFLRLPVAWPDKCEQTRLADMLDEWDAAIAKAEKLAEESERRFRYSLKFIFRNAQTTFENWKVTEVTKIAEIVGGGTPATNDLQFWDGDIPWCTPSDLSSLSGRFISKTERCISPKGLKASSAQLLPAGSVILCSRASVGECAINTVPMATNQGFQSLVPHDPRDLDFIYFMIRANQRQLLRISAGSTFLEFSRGELKKLKFPMPKPKERRRLGELFVNLDEQRAGAHRAAILLRQQKRGVMQRLFTDGFCNPDGLSSAA